MAETNWLDKAIDTGLVVLIGLVRVFWKRFRTLEKRATELGKDVDKEHRSHQRTRRYVNALWRKAHPSEPPPLSDDGARNPRVDGDVN